MTLTRLPLRILAEPAAFPAAEPEGMPDSAEPVVDEVGGRADRLDPTRYGDWEKNGRCIDF